MGNNNRGSDTPFADDLPLLQKEIGAFERAKREEVQRSTWLTYERTLSQFVQFLVSEDVEELDDIEPRCFRGFDYWLRDRGNKRTTRRKKHKQLQTVCRDWAAFEGAPRRWIKDIDQSIERGTHPLPRTEIHTVGVDERTHEPLDGVLNYLVSLRIGVGFSNSERPGRGASR